MGSDPTEDTVVTGVQLIERERQQLKWGDPREEAYSSGELSRLAACYAVSEKIYFQRQYPHDIRFIDVHPFESRTLSHTTTKEERINDLVRAGALIAAEIDRLQQQKPRE